MIYDAPSATVKLYFDGKLVSECGGFTISPSNITMPNLLLIGREYWASDENSYLNAELSCFRIYNRALR